MIQWKTIYRVTNTMRIVGWGASIAFSKSSLGSLLGTAFDSQPLVASEVFGRRTLSVRLWLLGLFSLLLWASLGDFMGCGQALTSATWTVLGLFLTMFYVGCHMGFDLSLISKKCNNSLLSSCIIIHAMHGLLI